MQADALTLLENGTFSVSDTDFALSLYQAGQGVVGIWHHESVSVSIDPRLSSRRQVTET